MKPSKKPSRKYFFFFAFTFAICFGIGLARGSFPNEWRIFFEQSAHPIYFLASDPKLIPTQIFLAFEKTHGTQVQFKSVESFHLFQSEVQKADLILAPISWLPEISANSTVLPNWNHLQDFLNEDFRSLRLRPEIFLPLFWTVTPNKELKLWGFYSLKETELQPDTMALIEYLLDDPEKLAGWVLKVGSASTLESMNSRNDLSTELKPVHLRDFQMQNLKINTDK